MALPHFWPKSIHSFILFYHLIPAAWYRNSFCRAALPFTLSCLKLIYGCWTTNCCPHKWCFFGPQMHLFTTFAYGCLRTLWFLMFFSPRIFHVHSSFYEFNIIEPFHLFIHTLQFSDFFICISRLLFRRGAVSTGATRQFSNVLKSWVFVDFVFSLLNCRFLVYLLHTV